MFFKIMFLNFWQVSQEKELALEFPVKMFSCKIGKVFKNTFNRTLPLAGSVVFATKQLNIQCYNNNFELKGKLSGKYCTYHHSTYTRIQSHINDTTCTDPKIF